MKQLFYILLLSIFLGSVSYSQTSGQKDSIDKLLQRMAYERSDNEEIERKIDELLQEMTIEEKIGQMIQITVDVFSRITEYNESESGIIHIELDTAQFIPFLTKYPISSIINGYGFTPENWIEYENAIQGLNQKYTRLKIPIIHAADHQHGANYIHGSTIFPHSLNMAATFNTDLLTKEGQIVGIESADLGHHWILGPIADLGVNPLWPRIFETYGEDPYLTKSMAVAYLDGRINNPDIAPYKQATCAKHFLAYSDPKAGWDRTPTDISNQTLMEFHVPPFKAVIDNGIHAIMLSSSDLNGVPVHGSYEIVTTLLRDHLGFKGVVITDWDDIYKMARYHKVARNNSEATLLSLNAGIDITMSPFDLDFGDILLEYYKEGIIPVERINLSVARILRMKLQIGLFDNYLPRNDRLEKIGCKEHNEVALQASRESIVLIKNDNLLPLNKKTSNILLAGPNANLKRVITGGWTYRWWPRTDDYFPENMHTVYTALQAEFENSTIILADSGEIVKKAAKADVIILALGENTHAEGFGNFNDILLPENQKMLIKEAQSTNKPVIIVMIGARPLIATEGFNKCSAFIWAGLSGVYGGQAIAEIISGKINPSGKMSISYPAYSGHILNYNHKSSDVLYDIPPKDPLTAIAWFGEGLSYSDFEYSDITLSDTIVNFNSTVKATITIANNSTIDGKESVLWFISDEYATITRPVKQLKYFEKKLVPAGEAERFEFEIVPEKDLSFTDSKGKQIIETGYFTLSVGDKTARFKLIK